MTPAQLATLKTELTTDPRTYGYLALIPVVLGGTSTAPLDSNGVAKLINLRRDGTNGGTEIILRRNDVLPLEVLSAIDTRDLKASPSILEGSWLESILQLAGGSPLVLFNDDDTRTLVANNILRLVSSNTQGSQTRLDAIGKRAGSRAEELGFGKGYRITDVDVEAALRLP